MWRCFHFFKQNQIWCFMTEWRAYLLKKCTALSFTAAKTISLHVFFNSSCSFSNRSGGEAAYQWRKWSIWCGVPLRPRSWNCTQGQTSLYSKLQGCRAAGLHGAVENSSTVMILTYKLFTFTGNYPFLIMIFIFIDTTIENYHKVLIISRSTFFLSAYNQTKNCNWPTFV